jgi:hypothetical protein
MVVSVADVIRSASCSRRVVFPGYVIFEEFARLGRAATLILWLLLLVVSAERATKRARATTDRPTDDVGGGVAGSIHTLHTFAAWVNCKTSLSAILHLCEDPFYRFCCHARCASLLAYYCNTLHLIAPCACLPFPSCHLPRF